MLAAKPYTYGRFDYDYFDSAIWLDLTENLNHQSFFFKLGAKWHNDQGPSPRLRITIFKSWLSHLTCCLILIKLLTFSVPQFSHLENGANNYCLSHRVALKTIQVKILKELKIALRTQDV